MVADHRLSAPHGPEQTCFQSVLITILKLANYAIYMYIVHVHVSSSGIPSFDCLLPADLDGADVDVD